MIRAALIALLLSGCATIPPGRVTIGTDAVAPGGYTALCEREPTAPECGK